MNKTFITSDLNLTAYLISKGEKVKNTDKNGRFIDFYFDSSIEKKGTDWQFSPDKDMETVQKFIAEKEKILSFLKTKQNKTKGGQNARTFTK